VGPGSVSLTEPGSTFGRRRHHPPIADFSPTFVPRWLYAKSDRDGNGLTQTYRQWQPALDLGARLRTFLQRPELRDSWDVTIFVKTSDLASERRGVSRDAGRLGGEDAARQLYADRYRPAFDLYERLCAPEKNADVVLINEDIRRLQIHIRPNGKLGWAH
jgi:hypothetical protein